MEKERQELERQANLDLIKDNPMFQELTLKYAALEDELKQKDCKITEMKQANEELEELYTYNNLRTSELVEQLRTQLNQKSLELEDKNAKIKDLQALQDELKSKVVIPPSVYIYIYIINSCCHLFTIPTNDLRYMRRKSLRNCLASPNVWLLSEIIQNLYV